MSASPPAAAGKKGTAVASLIGQETGAHVVSARVEDRELLLAFQLDRQVHLERASAGVGAVRSRRLLHALWSLPCDISWSESELDSSNRNTLVKEGNGLVVRGNETVRRVYRPPGQIRAVAITRKSLADSVWAVAQFPTIFLRYAIAASCSKADADAIEAARAAGIGTIFTSRTGPLVYTSPQRAAIGAPGVYRWWLAEIGYDAWLQANAH